MLVALYGSFAVHFWLALVSLYRRTTLRMPAWEAAQLVLGLLVVPLIATHATGTRGGRQLLGIDVDYPLVLGAIWTDDFHLVQQTVLLLVVWMHVAVGLHFWLRLRAWYARALPFLYAAALLLPVLSLLGFATSGLEVRRQILEEGAAAAIFAEVEAADSRGAGAGREPRHARRRRILLRAGRDPGRAMAPASLARPGTTLSPASRKRQDSRCAGRPLRPRGGARSGGSPTHPSVAGAPAARPAACASGRGSTPCRSPIGSSARHLTGSGPTRACGWPVRRGRRATCR